MIVISGALVLVALVLLLVGLLQPELGYVYASIAVSLGSFVFLIVGILQRRREVLPGAEAVTAQPSAADPAAPQPVTGTAPEAADAADVPDAVGAAAAPEGLTPVAPLLSKDVSIVPAAAPDEADGDIVGRVLVVAGRPRYHVEGCRYLVGREVTAVAVADIRAEGYTACGVCKPDLALEAGAPPPQVAEVQTTFSQNPVPVAPVKTAPTKPPPPAYPSPAPFVPTDATQRGSVVVIPDRNKYHTADCRYVRGAEGVQVLTKVAATRAGYDACGVCKP